jgi:hypothetical protein
VWAEFFRQAMRAPLRWQRTASEKRLFTKSGENDFLLPVALRPRDVLKRAGEMDKWLI